MRMLNGTVWSVVRRCVMLLGSLLAVASEVAAAPNVILIAVDTLRADHMGCYGYGRPTTPHIDRLAVDGVKFMQCYSPASWTLPAFASIFTGLMPTAHGVVDPEKKLSAQATTIAEALKASGYYTGAVVSNPSVAAKFGFGRGFDHYDDYSVFLEADLAALAADGSRQQRSHVDMVTGEVVVRRAQQLIDGARRSNKPSFLFIHFFDPHVNYIPAEPYRRWVDPAYRGLIDGRNTNPLKFSPPLGADLEHLVALYDGEVLYNDEQVGKLMEMIDRAFDPRDTIIILLSDHGEAFGEHGTMFHQVSTFEEEVHVPLIWRWKGTIPPDDKVNTPVSTLDIARTLREILKLEGLDHTQGRSLAPALMNPTASLPVESVFTERAYRSSAHQIALRRGDMKYHIWYNQSPDEASARHALFDLAHDRHEKLDLSGRRGDVANAMRSELLAQWAYCQQLRSKFGSSAADQLVLDEDERRALEGLGYLQSTTRPSTK